MKLNITKKHYKTLVKSLEMAASVYGISGDMIDEKYKKVSKEIEDLSDYILSFAKDFDMGDRVEVYRGKHYVKDEYRDEVMGDLMEYEDYAFFDTLVRKLARKEFFETYTEEERRSKGEEACMRIIWELEEKYWDWANEGGFDDWERPKIE